MEVPILSVEKLQCIKILNNHFTDRNRIKDIDLARANLVKLNRSMFGIRTVRGVSFSIKQGESFAILGDRRGCTSIMEALMGIRGAIAGSVKVNEIENPYPRQLRGLVGYQPHKNAIDEDLTVI